MKKETKWIAIATAVVALFTGGTGTGMASGSSTLAQSASQTSNAQLSSSSTPIPQPTAAQLKAAGLHKLPLAPDSARVDLVAPPFSNSTAVTNPLFPISDLHSAILNGRVDGKPFRTETTLLPNTRIIEWTDGQPVEVLVSQYVAYLDGRLQEVALDFYAQADDGSVWYFGEDVYNYNKNGDIADTSGTWLAGKEGPAAMIMAADPQVGQAFRPENIPGLVFEEVTVKATDEIVDGPQGPVDGAMVGEELHDDGSFSDKVFAPGYGEFYSAHEGDVEALALAVPTDALPGAMPAELEILSSGADTIFKQAAKKNWSAASATVNKMTAAWKTFQAGDVPPRLVGPTSRAIETLVAAVEARDPAAARDASIDVAYATFDLQLRHRSPAEIDLARFDLWARQILVDATADDLGGVTGDLATLEWIRDRFAHTVDPVKATRIDKHLEDLRDNVVDKDLRAAARETARLRDTLAKLKPVTSGMKPASDVRSMPSSSLIAARVGSQPPFDSTDFDAGIANPLFPLEPGTVVRFRGKTEDGIVMKRSTVTDDTKEILGVTTKVVKSTERFRGHLTELDYAWYAEDGDGNVWYFGEDTAEYEDGKVVSRKGSWEAGVDGAQPGILMNADPQVTDSHRQEYFKGEAEDMYWVVATGESKAVPFGTFNDVVRTLEWTPLEPRIVAAKFYAPGVGLIAERALSGATETVELLDVDQP